MPKNAFVLFFIANNTVFWGKKTFLKKSDLQALLVNPFSADDGYIRQKCDFLRIDFKNQYLNI